MSQRKKRRRMWCHVPTPCSPGPRQEWGPVQSPRSAASRGFSPPPRRSPLQPVSPPVLARTRAVFSFSCSLPLARRRRRAPHVSVSFPFLLLAPSFPAPFPLSLRPGPLSASSSHYSLSLPKSQSFPSPSLPWPREIPSSRGVHVPSPIPAGRLRAPGCPPPARTKAPPLRRWGGGCGPLKRLQ